MLKTWLFEQNRVPKKCLQKRNFGTISQETALSRANKNWTSVVQCKGLLTIERVYSSCNEHRKYRPLNRTPQRDKKWVKTSKIRLEVKMKIFSSRILSKITEHIFVIVDELQIPTDMFKMLFPAFCDTTNFEGKKAHLTLKSIKLADQNFFCQNFSKSKKKCKKKVGAN